jgi:hypothetical protein
VIFAALAAALTLHVTAPVTRSASLGCGFAITAHVVEGGTQRTCLTSVSGFPGPNVVMHSRGTMTFVLRRGAIRARIAVTQRFGVDGKTARQTLTGTITGGSGTYRGARGRITGGGTLVDTALGLSKLRLGYRLAFAG